MKGFTTGLVAGAMIAAGLAMAANPISKRDMRRFHNSSKRAMKCVGRKINKWM